jgi:ElaA protein
VPADALTWSEVPGPDLDPPTLHDVLALRSAVFVVEQACAYQDIDGLDLVVGTVHVLGHDPGSTAIAAYARVLAPDSDHATPRIGRVIVAPASRGRQLARELMTRALGACAERWPGEAVELGAQAHLTGFYASLGFQPVGEPYDEDGIRHQWMRLD